MLITLVKFLDSFFEKAALNITADVYIITIITNQRRVSNGNDFTIKAAIKTAKIPGMAIPMAAFLL